MCTVLSHQTQGEEWLISCSLYLMGISMGLGSLKNFILFFLYVGGLECVGHSFAYVAHFVFLRDV
jgi:hypothetical protein